MVTGSGHQTEFELQNVRSLSKIVALIFSLEYNQIKIHARETKIPDLVLFINGIPVVVGELKTPVRPAVSWYDAAHELHNIYQ